MTKKSTYEDLEQRIRTHKKGQAALKETSSTPNGMRDITDRKQAKEAELLSTSPFEQLFHKAAVPLCFVNKEVSMLKFNKQFEKTFGYSQQEISTLEEWWLLAYPDPDYRKWVIDTCYTELERAAETNTDIKPIEFEVTCKNGDIRTIIVFGSFIGDDLLLTFLDITERKQAEASLRQSEERYRTIFQASPLSIFRSTVDGELIEVNHAFAEMFGYDSSEEALREIHRKGEKQFFSSEDWKRIMAEQLASIDTIQHEIQLRKKDGKEFFANLYQRAIFDTQGQPIFFDGFIEDISERKQAEEQIRDSEVRFRTLVDHAADAFFLHDNDERGTILDVNHQACDSLGYNREELIGMTPYDYDAGLGPASIEQLEARMDDGKMIAFETLHRRKDGTVFPVEVRARPLWQGERQLSVALVRDITERKQAEEKLKESEERFRSIFEQAANAIALIDADNGNIIEFNQRAHEGLGYSREEFEKLSLADIDALESPEDVKAHADKVREMGSDIFETKHITREGNLRDMLISAHMLNAPGKNRFMSIWTDITERKQAEQERLANVHFLESMGRVNRAMQGTNDLEQMMGDVLDEVLSIFDCDRAFLLYPCDPEAASWSAPMERTKPEYPCIHAKGLKTPMDPDASIVCRLLLESDGPVKFGPDSVHPLKREMSRRFGYKSEIVMAIYPRTGAPWVFGLHQCPYPRVWTEQEERLFQEIGRRLEDALTSLLMYRNLQESEQRYRMVFENSPVSIWEEDFSGVKNLFDGLRKEKVTDIEAYFAQHPEAVRQCADLVKIVDVNRVTVEMHGAANKEELLAGLVNTFTPESFDTFRQELICLWNGCTEMASDAVIKTLAGDRRNVLVYFSVCSGHEQTLSKVIVSLTDITERKRLEEELIRAQKLEFVGLLAGGIAHDFNNILTVILGNVSMARMQVASEDDIFKMLSEAEMATMRAQALTKQLLTFAKGGAPVKETASIKDLLKESSSFALRGSKSICDFSIAEDLWPVDMDVGQMSQVINNIIINSNQAMPEGGTIQVAAENLIIEDSLGLPVKPGRYIKISITDQGVGILEKHLLHIFDPYFTTKHEGSGLGLATTYSIIKKHDGHITVESQVGVGTTFHIYLPASDRAVSKKEEVKLIKGRGRILVMDDQAFLRKIVGKMLEKLGYESEFAKNGAEAIEMYKRAKEAEKHYAAVILDLTIPGGMGGKETIKNLLEIDPEIKAIVSSGYSDDPVLANFQEHGFKGMIPKPFEYRCLGKVLHEVLKDEKD